MNKDYFQSKASEYEKDKKRVDNVENIANAIIRKIDFNRDMHIMDFGSGTGLLLEKIAPLVRKITAVDISRAMNTELQAKREKLNCELEILEKDLTLHSLDDSYDGIISSMTMHHIKDIDKMFRKFYKMLKVSGFIAIADLESEDGSFHTEDTGVFHFGFDKKEFLEIAQGSGFDNVETGQVSVAYKPQGSYPIFLLTAKKL